MHIKKLLRRLGFDIVRYRSVWDDVIGPLQPRTILDIGANNGVFAHEMRSRFPEATIYSFEPLRDCFEELNLRMQGDTKFRAWNVALGAESGEATIQRSSFHPSSSLLPMLNLHKELYPKSAGSSEEKIIVARLDDIAADIEIEQPLFIKTDVQGFEAQVISGGQQTFSKAQAILIETSFVPLYEGQPLFSDIHAQLTQLGFEYRGRGDTHYNPHTKELIYEDSLFIKKG